MPTAIPANWVAAGYGVPRVCSRHGEPAVAAPRTRLQSPPPGWAYLLLLVAVLAYVIAVSLTRKVIIAPSWPFCPRCKTLRVRRLIIGLVGLVGGVALFCGGVASSGNDGRSDAVAGLLSVLGLIVAIAGLAVVARSARAAVARARVSQDGVWVEVLKPDSRFAAEAAALLQQATAQQGYTQQVYPPPAYAQYPYVQPYGAPQSPDRYWSPGTGGPFAPPR